mmetsp:Transcript_20885/g.57362  ORF Transcript_20885/g.57362 Transcript_20885/m.57362 type:complete len:215 (-) Transcript_20885:4-648(-)
MVSRPGGALRIRHSAEAVVRVDAGILVGRRHTERIGTPWRSATSSSRWRAAAAAAGHREARATGCRRDRGSAAWWRRADARPPKGVPSWRGSAWARPRNALGPNHCTPGLKWRRQDHDYFDAYGPHPSRCGRRAHRRPLNLDFHARDPRFDRRLPAAKRAIRRAYRAAAPRDVRSTEGTQRSRRVGRHQRTPRKDEHDAQTARALESPLRWPEA